MDKCIFKDKNGEWEIISISDFNGYKKYEIKKVGDDYNLEVHYGNYSWIDVCFEKYSENKKIEQEKFKELKKKYCKSEDNINFGF